MGGERTKRSQFLERYSGRLLINDNGALDLGGMRRFIRGAEASRLVRPVKMVVLDYLGMLTWACSTRSAAQASPSGFPCWRERSNNSLRMSMLSCC